KKSLSNDSLPFRPPPTNVPPILHSISPRQHQQHHHQQQQAQQRSQQHDSSHTYSHKPPVSTSSSSSLLPKASKRRRSTVATSSSVRVDNEATMRELQLTMRSLIKELNEKDALIGELKEYIEHLHRENARSARIIKTLQQQPRKHRIGS